MPIKPKLYIYVDETGQDTRGAFFLVNVIPASSEDLEEVRASILALERRSKRGKNKWVKSTVIQRAAYLDAVKPVLARLAPVYWRSYFGGKDYPVRTAETIVGAARHRDPDGIADLVIVIDGLNWAERKVITRVFRDHSLRRRKVRRGQDEAEPFLRLADSLAGFLRDVQENRPAALPYWEQLCQHFHEV